MGVPGGLGPGAFLWLGRTLRHEASALALCVPGKDLDAMGLGPVVVPPVPATAGAPAGAPASAPAGAQSAGRRFAPAAASEDDATVTPRARPEAANPTRR